MDNAAKYAEKLARINDALAMKEPDRVPVIPFVMTYGVAHNGSTVAQAMYDPSVADRAFEEYLDRYDPDCNYGISNLFVGMGPVFDALDARFLQWAGKPGSGIDPNSMHQFIEKAYLDEDEYPLMFEDLTGWVMGTYLPKVLGIFEPVSSVNMGHAMLGFGSAFSVVQFADPRIAETFAKLGEIAREKLLPAMMSWGASDGRMIEKGYPLLLKPTTTVAFDTLSDCLRGTLGTMSDIVEQPENVLRATEMFYAATTPGAIAQAQASPGLVVHIPLHKGFDGFLSNEQYREFYWPTMLRLTEELLANGLTPYVYTEGKYDSRLEIIKDLPAGCVVHFEDCDMAEAKRLVGDHCCITGGFDDKLLSCGTPAEVSEAVKRLLDVCAPGGGYMFDVNCTLEYDNKPENVEAMFETAREYGKY